MSNYDKPRSGNENNMQIQKLECFIQKSRHKIQLVMDSLKRKPDGIQELPHKIYKLLLETHLSMQHGERI